MASTIDLMDEAALDVGGPFKYNVYISYEHCRSDLADKLCRDLEGRFKLKCCTRNHVDDFHKSMHARIQERVFSSMKCVVLLTPEYNSTHESCDDAWDKVELALIKEKVDRFTSDMVIVIKFPGVAKVPDELTGLTAADISGEEGLLADKMLQELADKIKRYPHGALTLLPKINMGYSSALGFFYGFLRLVLPDFTKRCRRVITEHPEMKGKTATRMLIILPTSCMSNPSFSDITDKIEFSGHHVIRFAHRAGNIQRDYKSSIYKFNVDTLQHGANSNQQRVYYFVGELATPLLTLYESYYFGITGMTRDQLDRERDVFYFVLKQVLEHPNHRPRIKNQYRLIWWDDELTVQDGSLTYKNKLESFLEPILKEEIAWEERNAYESSEEESPAEPDNNVAVNKKGDTCRMLDTEHVLASAFYESQRFESYKMDSNPKAKCIIICIENYYDNDDVKKYNLKARPGAGKDSEMMKKVFKDLKCEVELHEDITLEAFEQLLLTTSLINHNKYDAFVCVIMTHGHLGEVFSSDGKPIRILDITSFFSADRCRSLKGKPKLFFIQSCQQSSIQTPNGAPNGLANESGAVVTDMAELHLTSNEVQPPSLWGDQSPRPTLQRDNERQLTTEIKAQLVPGEPDFLMSYSTLPGTVSYRHPDGGSLYVQAISDNLGKKDEIDRILKQVTKDVGTKLSEYRIIDKKNYADQLPFHLTTGMSKLLYFA